MPRTGNWEFSAPAKGVIELNQTVEHFEAENVNNNTEYQSNGEIWQLGDADRYLDSQKL